MASKNIIIKRKIANDIYELMPKTTGEQVSVTYGNEVQALSAVLATVYTDLEAWNTFKANVDFAGTDAALDTLRELIDMIGDEEVATSIASQLGDIKDRLDTLEGKVTTLEGTVETQGTDISTLKTKVGTLETDNTANKEAIAKNAEDIAANAEAIAANAEAIAKNAQDIATANENIGKNATAITELQGGLAASSKVVYLDAEAVVPDTVGENDIIIQEV